MLSPDFQEAFRHAAPDLFEPVSGGWGRGGATTIDLKNCKKAIARDALAAAWRRRAPKRLLKYVAAE